MESDDGLPDRFRDDLRMIRRNVELEARLIDDLLDATRIARGKMSLALRVVDACRVLRHAAETCRAEAIRKGVELTMEVTAPEGTTFLFADPARLQQIFWNLLKNAIKFTPKGGRVTVRCFTRKSGADPVLVLEVRDTGVGIPPASLPYLFEVFEQGGDETTRKYGGLGLGLAISRGLVNLHGGTITAASEGVGKGATFTVELPLADPRKLSEEPEEGRADPRPAASPEKALSILLVEDHESTASVLAKLLRTSGFQVNVAGSVEAALSEYGKGRFDLVISDLGLPDGDGYQLIEKVFALRPVPAIALTGYGMEGDIAKTRAAGFREHLTKPVGATQLKEAISRLTAAGSATPA